MLKYFKYYSTSIWKPRIRLNSSCHLKPHLLLFKAASPFTSLIAPRAITSLHHSHYSFKRYLSSDTLNNNKDKTMEQLNDNRNSSKLNRLANEKSPYLLQHKENPVDWYPWGDEAFNEAKKQNKMIFLSVGYSTCHWCHVMAHESFEDPKIAAIMNDYFINIKVDREERPDVDKIYMTFLQAYSGGGGWPMSVFLTPSLEPVIAGTYFPAVRNYGQISFPELLELIHKEWITKPEEFKVKGQRFIEVIKSSMEEQYSASTKEKLSLDPVYLCYKQIKSGYDPVEGGFSKAPKFPRPVIFELLYKIIARENIHSEQGKDALQMNLLTLKKMGLGGIYDHLGGGFHRYSVTKDWHIPHFEKMLYDNAQLVPSYLMAFQLTNDRYFEEKVKDILQYIQTKIVSPEGGFYSAEDADSLLEHGKKDHAEGAFYVWKKSEIDTLLSDDHAKIFNHHYGVLPDGNSPPGGDPHGEFKGKNVLIQRHSVKETADHFHKSEADIETSLKHSRTILYQHREKRPHPHLDDKIITAWNGLMISAFSQAFQVLGDPIYLKTAINACEFIRKNLYLESEGALIRNYRQGPSNIRAFADDYAFLIAGLLDLYEASFDLKWLQWAIDLQKKQDALFLDVKNGGYFGNQEGDASLLLRMKEDYDGAEPSNNSVSANNLLRLSFLTHDKNYRQNAERILLAFKGALDDRPIVAPLLTSALDLFLHSPPVVVIVGDPEDTQTKTFLKQIHDTFLPNKVMILLNTKEEHEFFVTKLEYLKEMKKINGKTTVYICENFTCQLPVFNSSDLDALLKKVGGQKAI